MKILLVSNSAGLDGKSGGAAIACRRLMEALILAGHQVKMLTLTNTKGDSILNQYSINSLAYFFFRVYRYFFYSRAYKTIKKHHIHSGPKSPSDIKSHELYKWADIINLHWVSGLLDYPSFFSPNVKKPVVWTLHDMNAFTGGCHYSESCHNYKTTCESCPQLKSSLQYLSLTNLVVKASCSFEYLSIITPSIWLKKLSSSSLIFKDIKHEVIPNAVDTSIFKMIQSDRDKAPKAGPKKILFIANDVSIRLKGLHLLKEALNIIDEELNLYIIGKGEASLNLKHKQFILGSVHEEKKLVELFNESDLFVTSSLEDNLPNVIVESLCCGTPVVGFRTGGIPELIIEGFNGYLAIKNDEYDLALKIDQALSHSWNRNEISSEAHKKFNSINVAKKYLAEFEKRL